MITFSSVEHPLATVLGEHALEAIHLRLQRQELVRAPHVGLFLLGRHDQRLAAHLDGLLTAGPAGLATLQEHSAVEGQADIGAAFAPAALALLRHHTAGWSLALDLLKALPTVEGATCSIPWRGLLSALGWVSANDLRGVVQPLLAAMEAGPLALGLACCRLHRVDPGSVLPSALTHPSPVVLVQALRTAAALKRFDLLPAVLGALSHGDPEVTFHAAHAACLLGERRACLPVLAAAAQSATTRSLPGIDLAFAALPPAEAAEWARRISFEAAAAPSDARLQRLRLRAIGLLGDPRFVPWLIEQMADPALARLAGQALVWIAGVDFTTAGIESLEPRPLTTEAEDENAPIELDEDDSLPWPEVPKVYAWWQRHAGLFANGTRLLAGRPRDAACARHILLNGTQRLRAHAALLQAALEPPTVLLPIAAPAWRQQRWLQAG